MADMPNPTHARDDSWTTSHALLGVAVGLLGAAVAILGFIDIYLTVTHLLHALWGDWAWTVIVLGEGSAAGAYLGWLLLDLRDQPPRRVQVFVAAYLSLFMTGSLVLNLYAGGGTVPGVASHAVVVAAFFGYLIFIKVLVARLSTDAATRALEQAMTDARQHAIDLCRDRKGIFWRRRIPALLRRQIVSGRLCDKVRSDVQERVGKGQTSGWEGTVRTWVFRELNVTVLAEQADAEARAALARPAAQDARPSAPESTPEAPPQARPERRPPARSGPALKLAASASRTMSPTDLSKHVAAMLDEYGTVSDARVRKDLHVGAEKAAEALRLAKRARTVVSIDRTGVGGSPS